MWFLLSAATSGVFPVFIDLPFPFEGSCLYLPACKVNFFFVLVKFGVLLNVEIVRAF